MRRLELYGRGCILLGLLSLSLLPAQDVSPRDSEDDPTKSVNLSLQINRDGSTRIYFSSTDTLPSFAEARNLLMERWQCVLNNREPVKTFRLRQLTPEQQARIDAVWKAAAERNFSAICQGPLHREGLSVKGKLDLQPLVRLLRRDGVDNVLVTLRLPDTPMKYVSGPDGGYSSNLLGWYQLSVSPETAPVQVSFGYSRRDIARLAFYTSLFVAVPVLIVLLMRTAALRRGGDDTASSWFSFMQATQLCMTGTFLLWGVTQLNTRAQLSDLAAFAGWNDGWAYGLSQSVIFTAPSWAVYVICTALSYKIFVRMGKVTLSWSQFMFRQVAQVGRAFFPLTLYLAGLFTLIRNFSLGICLFGLAWLARLVLAQLHQKLEKSHPSAITSGPLRDRIFALAEASRVKLQQVFVIPTAKSGVANAFATTQRTVIFTDYLIEKLTQREVDAIAAHELTHLRHNHAQTLGLMYLGALLLPRWILGFAAGQLSGLLTFIPAVERYSYRVSSALLTEWAQAGLMLVLLWAYFQIRRNFEYTADAGGVALTRDPEAMITGLVKISRLNLTPLQWGRGSEATLTHPSTMRRLQRIAQSCSMPSGHLEQLIAAAQHPASAPPADAYSVLPQTPGVVSTGKSTARAQKNLLILIGLHLLPAAALLLAVQKFLPGQIPRWWALLPGAIGCVGVYQLGLLWLNAATNQRMIRVIFKVLSQKIAPFSPEQGIPVGFAPSSSPRFYVASYNWDQGLLFIAPEKIIFVGSHCRLGLSREQIRTVVLGQGAPRWGSWQRVYFSWQDKASGTSGVFNLVPLRQKSLFRADSRALYLQLRAWRTSQDKRGDATPGEFGPPNLGAVTSMAAKEVHKFSRTFPIMATMLALAAGLAAVLKLDYPWYLPAIVVLIRLFESIPHMLYRDRPMVYDANNAPGMIRPAPLRPAVPQPPLPSFATPPPPPPASFATPPPPPPSRDSDGVPEPAPVGQT